MNKITEKQSLHRSLLNLRPISGCWCDGIWETFPPAPIFFPSCHRHVCSMSSLFGRLVADISPPPPPPPPHPIPYLDSNPAKLGLISASQLRKRERRSVCCPNKPCIACLHSGFIWNLHSELCLQKTDMSILVVFYVNYYHLPLATPSAMLCCWNYCSLSYFSVFSFCHTWPCSVLGT